ncbi:MAG: hypothetical protein NY202_02800 [Mollicutes bacterium UO1]
MLKLLVKLSIVVGVQENINNRRESQAIPNQTQSEKAIEQMKEYLKGTKWSFCIKEREGQDKKIFYERIGINTLSH